MRASELPLISISNETLPSLSKMKSHALLINLGKAITPIAWLMMAYNLVYAI